MRTGKPSLRHGMTPRGLSRVEASMYVGISASKFDQMVADGRMPPPKRIDARKIWDRDAIDSAFSELPDDPAFCSEAPWDAEIRSWDEALG